MLERISSSIRRALGRVIERVEFDAMPFAVLLLTHSQSLRAADLLTLASGSLFAPIT